MSTPSTAPSAPGAEPQGSQGSRRPALAATFAVGRRLADVPGPRPMAVVALSAGRHPAARRPRPGSSCFLLCRAWPARS